jgi:hypothetical protein
MKSLFPFIIIVSLITSAYSQEGWRDHEMEVKVKISNQDEARILYNLHLNGDIYSPAGYAIMYVVPVEFEQLKKTGLNTEVLKINLNGYYKNFWSDRADQYHNYDQIIALMDSLATVFPDICQKTVFGLTPQGRELTCLKISDNPGIDENEPEILFDGGIHGDEIGGPENLIRFARDLCVSYGNDPGITDLVNSHEITIYPMVNPDGRANMSRYNSNQVDCNRDWGYMWNGEGNSPGAFSQLETRTIRDCIYNRRFVIHVTYHSGEQAVLYPWCYRSAHVPDYNALIQLASVYSISSGYSNLQYRQSYADYPTNGETIDYSYGADGTDALTMEISNSKQPPNSQIQYYYLANVPSMIAMIKNAGYGIGGTVTDSITGLPVEAAIFVDDFFPVYTDTVVGDYHKYLPQGTYSLKVIANHYLTKVINNVVVNGQTSTLMDVQLQPASGHYGMKVGAAVIPGNNPMDEANTPGVIGKPDSICYSTGKNGWIIIDMQDSVTNIQGDDFTVYEGDTVPEGFTCLVGPSLDGPWISLGTGTGTTSFDLESAGVTAARFIKILDDGIGQQNISDAGFDLDAVESMSPPTNIRITEGEYGSLKVYPNPANETVAIEVKNNEKKGTMTICNVQGKVLIKKNITNGIERIDTSDLASGVYFVNFSNGRTNKMRKLIISKSSFHATE